MKLFLDTANLAEIRQAAAWGVISGVTTNPSLAAREKEDFTEILPQICNLVDGPVSAEVLAEDHEGMIKEARHLAGIHENVNIKIPITPEGMQAVKTLAGEGIKTNVTLVFSANQALLAARAGPPCRPSSGASMISATTASSLSRDRAFSRYMARHRGDRGEHSPYNISPRYPCGCPDRYRPL